MPLISVITSVYNCERYLIQSLDSILSQTLRDFELIIVNDGSTDNCDSIVRSYNDNRIRYIFNSDNKKIPTRRNEAIQIARGEFIAIHDGDDISLPDRLEKQYNFLLNNYYFCVGGHAYKIDLNGYKIGEMTYPPLSHQENVQMLVKKCMNPIIDPTTMFRRQDFLQLSGYTLNEEIYTVPDFDLWCRAIYCGKRVANIQEPLIRYRVNPKGMTGQHKQEMIKAHMVVWKRFLSQYSNGNFYDQK